MNFSTSISEQTLVVIILNPEITVETFELHTPVHPECPTPTKSSNY